MSYNIVHSFCVHRFDLMTKVASKYTTSVTDKLSKLERMEQDLNTAAVSLAQTVDEVNNSARKAQERLERHCNGKKVMVSLLSNYMYIIHNKLYMTTIHGQNSHWMLTPCVQTYRSHTVQPWSGVKQCYSLYWTGKWSSNRT